MFICWYVVTFSPRSRGKRKCRANVWLTTSCGLLSCCLISSLYPVYLLCHMFQSNVVCGDVCDGGMEEGGGGQGVSVSTWLACHNSPPFSHHHLWKLPSKALSELCVHCSVKRHQHYKHFIKSADNVLVLSTIFAFHRPAAAGGGTERV